MGFVLMIWRTKKMAECGEDCDIEEKGTKRGNIGEHREFQGNTRRRSKKGKGVRNPDEKLGGFGEVLKERLG